LTTTNRDRYFRSLLPGELVRVFSVKIRAGIGEQDVAAIAVMKQKQALMLIADE